MTITSSGSLRSRPLFINGWLPSTRHGTSSRQCHEIHHTRLISFVPFLWHSVIEMLLRKFFFIFLSLVTATTAASDSVSDSERPQCAVSLNRLVGLFTASSDTVLGLLPTSNVR